MIMTTQMLTISQLCKRLNVTRKQLFLMRKSGLPTYRLTAGGQPRFDFEEVKMWMLENNVRERETVDV